MSQETEMQPYREGLDELAEHYKQVLTLLGEDTEREGLENRYQIQRDRYDGRCVARRLYCLPGRRQGGFWAEVRINLYQMSLRIQALCPCRRS